jgi:hypothetical protein
MQESASRVLAWSYLCVIESSRLPKSMAPFQALHGWVHAGLLGSLSNWELKDTFSSSVRVYPTALPVRVRSTGTYLPEAFAPKRTVTSIGEVEAQRSRGRGPKPWARSFSFAPWCLRSSSSPILGVGTLRPAISQLVGGQ